MTMCMFSFHCQTIRSGTLLPARWLGSRHLGVQQNRTQGVGIRFPSDEKSKPWKIKIEEILGGHLASERDHQTI